MIRKRILAYILDMLIVAMIVSLVGTFFRSDNAKVLYDESEKITEMFIHEEITAEQYINRFADVSHDLDKEYTYINIVEAMTLIGCFVIIPFSFNGQTIGKKLLKIKTVSSGGELTYNNFIIRSLLINGLGVIIILMSVVYLLPSMPYFIVKSIVELTEFVILIICLVKMIKSSSNVGLHDKLAKTEVVENN